MYGIYLLSDTKSSQAGNVHSSYIVATWDDTVWYRSKDSKISAKINIRFCDAVKVSVNGFHIVTDSIFC